MNSSNVTTCVKETEDSECKALGPRLNVWKWMSKEFCTILILSVLTCGVSGVTHLSLSLREHCPGVVCPFERNITGH